MFSLSYLVCMLFKLDKPKKTGSFKSYAKAVSDILPTKKRSFSPSVGNTNWDLSSLSLNDNRPTMYEPQQELSIEIQKSRSDKIPLQKSQSHSMYFSTRKCNP